ncbi:MAG: hypothetical protein M1530_01135 [Candidatus Marsarchaeota archaeon]|nr:hypothetical protein [Candidatus Marsarchaeota archaeon]
MKQHLVSKEGIRGFVRKEGFRISKTALKQAEDEFRASLLKSMRRADLNKRKTVQPQDM